MYQRVAYLFLFLIGIPGVFAFFCFSRTFRDNLIAEIIGSILTVLILDFFYRHKSNNKLRYLYSKVSHFEIMLFQLLKKISFGLIEEKNYPLTQYSLEENPLDSEQPENLHLEQRVKKVLWQKNFLSVEAKVRKAFLGMAAEQQLNITEIMKLAAIDNRTIRQIWHDLQSDGNALKFLAVWIWLKGLWARIIFCIDLVADSSLKRANLISRLSDRNDRFKGLSRRYYVRTALRKIEDDDNFAKALQQKYQQYFSRQKLEQDDDIWQEIPINELISTIFDYEKMTALIFLEIGRCYSEMNDVLEILKTLEKNHLFAKILQLQQSEDYRQGCDVLAEILASDAHKKFLAIFNCYLNLSRRLTVLDHTY